MNYPLISKKWCDFQLWQKVVQLMIKKEHLSSLNKMNEGFNYILSLYGSINRGISKNVAKNFTSITFQPKPDRIIPTIINPFWVSGFTFN